MDVFIQSLFPVMGFVFGGYILSRLLKRNDVADGLWGLGFLGVALANMKEPFSHLSVLQKITSVFVTLWAVRLSLYLFWRMKGKSEDQRYGNWRKEWGKAEPLRAFAQVFLLQGGLLFIISMPLLWIFQNRTAEVGPITFIGILFFLSGFVFESVGDGQLFVFKKNSLNSGMVMKSGLWAHTRHPNYFGEILVWWGFFFMALTTPFGIITVVSPLVITFLLLKVSGVPMLEKLLNAKGVSFQEYVTHTPAILPFSLRSFLHFIKVAAATLILDMVWLGFVAKDFYFNQTFKVARIQEGGFDTLIWAAGFVYLLIPLGTLYFSIKGAVDRWEAVFRGALLGLVIYGVYEFTNLALVKNWPIEMAAVDLIWGTFLCGVTAAMGFQSKKT